MANCGIVLGKSGNGKSTSIKGLNPDETIIINILGKRLPFKGSNSLYSPEKRNLFRVDNYMDLINLLSDIDSKATHIKNIVIDDAIFIMSKEFFKRAKEAGYGKFTELAMHFQQIISTCEMMREDINVFFLLHAEEVKSDNIIVGYKVRTVGKLLDDQYNPVEVVPVVLFADTVYDDKGRASFGFYTHKQVMGTIEIPAKTPDEMFTEDFIPNDLGVVVKAMNEYYG